jgi:Domain of unknown function (DUF4440)
VSAELEQAADALNRAVRDGDADAAAGLLHDGFVLTSSLGTGLHLEKAAWLESLPEISTRALGVRDGQLEVVGDVGVAVWRMDWEAGLGEDDLSGPYLVTDLWLRGEDGWRLRWRSWARLNAEFLVAELAR